MDIRFVSLLLFVVGFGFAGYCVALWVSWCFTFGFGLGVWWFLFEFWFGC